LEHATHSVNEMAALVRLPAVPAGLDVLARDDPGSYMT
jgi:hypothetical protein